MFVTKKSISRRTLLRGMGTAVALPFLDSMAPAMAQAPKSPVRMAFVYVPNGMDMRNWNLDYEGPLSALSPIMAPMEPLKQDMLLLGNLTHNTGRALLDGAGDHGRCSGSYLTGVQVRKTMTDILASVSMDQVVANKIGSATRFPSLELGLEDARQAGDCDSGYSCAYTNNLAWKSSTQPLPPILEPRQLFERLFGDGVALSPAERTRQGKYRRSILDFVLEDARTLQGELGPTDNRKLDEYLTSIREVERQIAKSESEAKIDPHMERPYGTPPDFAEHFKLMSDMLTIAFQADLTRVATFLVTHEGTSRAYRELGIDDGHHPLTHHRNQVDMMDKVTRINTYHVEQFSKWMQRMKATQEASGSVLDNSMIVYGAGLADPNNHIHDNLPTMLVGKGGGFLKTGRNVVYRKETPMCNLFLSMMDRMGAPQQHFGDSTGHLEELSA
ncbi:MAG: DUF1552 domain-containing protein [Bryobacteraceae bacterium]